MEHISSKTWLSCVLLIVLNISWIYLTRMKSAWKTSRMPLNTHNIEFLSTSFIINGGVFPLLLDWMNNSFTDYLPYEILGLLLRAFTLPLGIVWIKICFIDYKKARLQNKDIVFDDYFASHKWGGKRELSYIVFYFISLALSFTMLIAGAKQ